MNSTLTHVERLPQPPLGEALSVMNLVKYGVWIPRRGWLKVDNRDGAVDCYSDLNYDVVLDLARRFHGEVRYVDMSLFRLETQILQQEEQDEAAYLDGLKIALEHERKRRTPWRTFKIWLGKVLHR